MKLLFVFTGGTIGSTQTGDTISTDKNKSYKIINAYKEKYGIGFDYEVTEPYTELSENNTGKHIKMLAGCICEAIKKNYDGIIVTHGTDTLQYSASAIGYTLGLNSIPVCFVAANAPIESPVSNALDNLHGAVRFLESKGGRGVFVVYRNSASKVVLVHRATRLLESKAYSDEVISAINTPYGRLDGDFTFIKNPAYSEMTDSIATLSCKSIREVNNRAIVIPAYPGMLYPEIPETVKYIIVNTYHSGTLDTKSEGARKFFFDAKAKGITVFATGIYDGPQYASAKCYTELGINPIINISPVVAYIKLWLADSMEKKPLEIINEPLSGDVIC